MSLIGKDSIPVSISSDTCILSLARYASGIDGELNNYVGDQISLDLLNDLVSCESHRVGFNHGERPKCTAVQDLLDMLHNFARRHQINAGYSLESSPIFQGFYVDNSIRCAVQEIFFVRTPDGRVQLQLQDKLQHQVADAAIYLEVQVTDNRPFANKPNALSSTFSTANLHLPNPKEEELLIQYTTPTGQINDYQELLEMKTTMETTVHNNKFTAQVFFESVNYLLKWGAWNTIYVWLGSVTLWKKAFERSRNRTSMSSMVHYLWILRILISRLMGIVPFIYRTLNVESSAIVGSADLFPAISFESHLAF